MSGYTTDQLVGRLSKLCEDYAEQVDSQDGIWDFHLQAVEALHERDAYRDSINNARKRLAVSEAGAWRYLVAALGIDGDDPLVDLSEETT